MSSTPSILMSEVLGLIVCFARWNEMCLPLSDVLLAFVSSHSSIHARVCRGAVFCRIAVGYPPFVIRSSSSDGYFGADVLDVKSVTLLGRHLDGCSGDLKGELFEGSLVLVAIVVDFLNLERVASA